MPWNRSARAQRLIRAAVIPAAVLVALALVAGSSYSVFTGTTSTPSNSWSTGTVAMQNDSSVFGTPAATGSARFTVTNLRPNDGITSRCITVTYTGSLSVSTVKLFASSSLNENYLLHWIGTTISVGGGATDANCSGYTQWGVVYAGGLGALKDTATSYATGIDTGWQPTYGQSQQFRISTQPGPMDNTVQNSTARIDLIWGAQND